MPSATHSHPPPVAAHLLHGIQGLQAAARIGDDAHGDFWREAIATPLEERCLRHPISLYMANEVPECAHRKAAVDNPSAGIDADKGVAVVRKGDG